MQYPSLSMLLIAVLFGSLPALAQASGDHAHGHDNHALEHASTGRSGVPSNISRTVEVIMDDRMRFEPAHLNVKAGETVHFRVKNNGRLPHEMVIGTLQELQAHAEQMRSMRDMPHDEPGAIALDAGQQGDLLWQFGAPATLDFACLIAGHLEAGMKGTIEVH